ncbi:MAG: hypothetical protein COC16_03690 [Lutibacter sp.]|nr:MAG: hypothetical protein COC16_03690 [Lutibacter sp.]
MKKILIIYLLISSSIVISQEKSNDQNNINPFRIGLKIGTPNIVGGNIEYVLPVLNNHIALFADLSGFSLELDEVESSLSYFEIGTNIYLSDNGRGFYGTLSYGSFSVEGTYFDADLMLNGVAIIGEATGKLDVNTLNVKLGAKLGKKFYFRIEAGYGFGDIPQEITVIGTANGQPAIGTEEIPDVPGIDESGYALFNFGFGIAF